MPTGAVQVTRSRGASLVLLLSLPAMICAQAPPGDAAVPVSSAKILGASLGPVPDVLYAQCPTLPRGQGLVVELVEDKSAADRIGLHRHDILLQYHNTPIQNTKHFAQLLHFAPPGNPGQLLILRAGKPMTLECSLQIGDLARVSKAELKPNGPPAVSLEAKPLDKGKLKVILTYFGSGSKKETLTCTGTPQEIEQEIRHVTRNQHIPADVRELVEVALERFRMKKVRN
jgi:hypothetical protein